MNSFRLSSGDDLEAILQELEICPLDGSHIVTISDKKEKRSARQLRYMWKLIRFVAASGKGSNDTPEKVELAFKWLFLKPMLISADTRYAEVMQEVERKYAQDPELMKFVTGKLFHFSDLDVHEMAEVQQQITDYYGSKGVYLPIEEH